MGNVCNAHQNYIAEKVIKIHLAGTVKMANPRSKKKYWLYNVWMVLIIFQTNDFSPELSFSSFKRMSFLFFSNGRWFGWTDNTFWIKSKYLVHVSPILSVFFSFNHFGYMVFRVKCALLVVSMNGFVPSKKLKEKDF